MSRRPRPLFLEQKGYRRRRVIDAAKLLPLFGLLLFLLPVLRDPAATPDQETGHGILYLFGIWLLLIGCAARFSYLLNAEGDADDTNEAGN